MVLKVGKHGINSGNTLRVNSNNCYLRQYGTASCIIRRAIRRNGDFTVKYNTGLGDDDLKCDGVPFSLNKKGRWSLPELIKREVIDGNHTDDDFGIQLVERHKIAKSANCISICTSNAELDGRQERTKRQGYLQISSVLRRKSKYYRCVRRDRRRRGFPVDDEDDEQETEPTQVRYEVWYPSPSNCALTRNLKSIEFETSKNFGWDCYASRRRRNRNKQRISKHKMREAFRILDEEVEYLEEEAYWPSDEEQFSPIEPVNVTLEDIMDQAKALGNLVAMPGKIRRSSSENHNRAQSKTKNDRIVNMYEEVKPANNEVVSAVDTFELTLSTPARSTPLEPVIVILPFEEITPHALKARFDDCYTECDCFPRKFVLDISDKVSNMNAFKAYQKNTRTVNACIVVTVDEENEMNTLADSVCSVVLNTTYSEKIKSVKIETVFDYMETHLEELIGSTLFFIDTLIDGFIVVKTDAVPDHRYKGKQGKLTNLEELANWSTYSYTVDDGFLLTYFTSQGLNVETKSGYEVVSHFETFMANEQSDVSSQDGKLCGVCYEAIGKENPATALTSCSHWFCDKCWREHIDTKIRNGGTHIPCPEYNCEKEVDSGTTISFVSMTAILKLAKYRHDTEIQRLAVTRWCPNERCGRVLHVNSSDVKIATCVCGLQCCLECLGKPHWPADCKSVKLFQKRMVSKGDIGFATVEDAVIVNVRTVKGKSCPNCRRFIEKNGGCNYISCICGHYFRWGSEIYKRQFIPHLNCYDVRNNDKHTTQDISIDAENRLRKLKRHKWYKVALVHKVGQHPVKYKAMKSAAKTLTNKMKDVITRSEQKGCAISLDFQMAGKLYHRECEKVPDFLTSIIELHREASQLVENVAVLLDSQRSDKQTINTSLQYMIKRLAYFVNIIYEIFMNSNTRNVMDILTKMKLIRQNTRNVIRALVNLVSRNKF